MCLKSLLHFVFLFLNNAITILMFKMSHHKVSNNLISYINSQISSWAIIFNIYILSIFLGNFALNPILTNWNLKTYFRKHNYVKLVFLKVNFFVNVKYRVKLPRITNNLCIVLFVFLERFLYKKLSTCLGIPFLYHYNHDNILFETLLIFHPRISDYISGSTKIFKINILLIHLFFNAKLTYDSYNIVWILLTDSTFEANTLAPKIIN